jgi:hypothetical protein
MTFPFQSTEKHSLVPVIAMLLQFSTVELEDISRAENDPTWNPKPIRELKRTTSGGSPPASPSSSSSPRVKTSPLGSPKVINDAYKPSLLIPIDESTNEPSSPHAADHSDSTATSAPAVPLGSPRVRAINKLVSVIIPPFTDNTAGKKEQHVAFKF